MIAFFARVAATALMLTTLYAGLAWSGDDRYISGSDPISASSGTTYADLARLFAPGLGGRTTDNILASVRHLGGPDMAVPSPDREIENISRLDIETQGKPQTLVLFDFGRAEDAAQSISVLALYDLSGAPRLLDAMDVGMDLFTSFQEPEFLAQSSRLGVVFLRSSHSNAGEEFVQTSIVGIWSGKLNAVDTIGTMNWNGCSASISVPVSFSAVRGAEALEATADVQKQALDGGCPALELEKKIKNRRLKARYSWDERAGKFIADTKAFADIPWPNMEE